MKSTFCIIIQTLGLLATLAVLAFDALLLENLW